MTNTQNWVVFHNCVSIKLLHAYQNWLSKIPSKKSDLNFHFFLRSFHPTFYSLINLLNFVKFITIRIFFLIFLYKFCVSLIWTVHQTLQMLKYIVPFIVKSDEIISHLMSLLSSRLIPSFIKVIDNMLHCLDECSSQVGFVCIA